MRKLLRSSEVQVGLLVLVVSVLVAVFSMRVSEDPSYMTRSQTYWFLIEDASGLIKGGAVKMAGIGVGIIKDIQLHEGQAKLILRLNPEVPVARSSFIEVRPNGILGDKYVEIVAGGDEAEKLPDGEQIMKVSNKGSLDTLMYEVGRITDSLSGIADTIKGALSDGGKDSGPLGRILNNIEVVTGDLAELSKGRKDRIGEIVDNVHAMSETLNEMINDESDDGFRANWRRASMSLARIDRALANIEEITDKVNRGDGTIGRLINDDKTVEELNTALTGVNEFVGGANKLKTSLDFHSEYLMQQSLAKTYLGVRIQPGLDRYYEAQIIDDPKGVVETTDRTTTTNPGTSGETSTTTRERLTFRSKVKFTLLFAKNFYDLTIRAGLIESTGGLGLDYHFLRRSLRWSFDAFDLGNSPAHLRSYMRYQFWQGFYVLGGADDFISKTGTFSSYLGMGIDLTNDDLKTLVGKVSF